MKLNNYGKTSNAGTYGGKEGLIIINDEFVVLQWWGLKNSRKAVAIKLNSIINNHSYP